APDSSSGSEWSVFGFGQNAYGELGLGDVADRNAPTRVAFCDGRRVVDVACGNEQTVLLCESGDVFACGYNDSGQCGTGSTERMPSLRLVPALTGKNIIALFSGNGCEHLAALTASGSLFTVGFNGRGQLGHGSTLTTAEPAPVLRLAEKHVVDVACSYFHSAVVTSDGELFTCGRNDFGQLGTADGGDKHFPHPVSFSLRHPVLTVACGQHHTVASLSGGGLLVFGKNDYGQLGLGDMTGPVVGPTRVVGSALENAFVTKLACGYHHTVAVTDDGAVYTFGRNDFGQLGLGHAKHVARPTLVSALARVRVVQAACGCYHTLALSDDGRVYPFGRNNHGQLGLETALDCLSPQIIPSLRGTFVRKVAAGFYHSVCLVGGEGVAVSGGGSGGRTLARPGGRVRSTLSADLRKMLNNPARSDVTFVLEGGREFFAHGCVLMARCEPLEKMLDGRMKEGTLARIPIPDYSFDVFAALMEFLYTDQVAALASPSIGAEFLLELLALADQYLVANLCSLCETTILKILSVQNASLLLQTAHFRDAFALKKRCLSFILDRFGEVIATEVLDSV
ncbi:hypothetical protein PybrP1_006253, partial [[Pythium] brassicae (nom. inval.)]